MQALRPWRATAMSLLLFVALGMENSAVAQIAPSEYDLKAAFLYQFLSYVSWPPSRASADSLVLIGVVGAPELVDNLAILAANQAGAARMIEVRTLQPGSDPRGLHVLFVAAGRDEESAVMLQTAVADGVLTVTESSPRPPDSIINFEIIDNMVRFDVALGLARRNGLDVSGRLLQVALRVLEQP